MLLFLNSSNNTWEPEANLSKETVDEFNNQDEKEISPTSVENNVSPSNSKHSQNKETIGKNWSEDEYYVEEVLDKRIRNGMF